MRSSEERVAAVKRRTAQLEAQRRWRRRRAAALGSAAACLLLIICLSFAVPGISARLAEGNYGIYGAAASMFGGSAAAGYIIIGLLAFALGVLVTVLCFKLKLFYRSGGESGDDRNN